MRPSAMLLCTVAWLVAVGASPRAAAQAAAGGEVSEPSQADSSPADPSAQPPAEEQPAAAPPETVQVITAEQTNAQQKLRLSRELATLAHEREHASRLGPWLLTSVGIASLVVGLSVGIGHTFGCKGACRGPFWPGWLVIAGGTVTTVGVIWLTWKNEDIAELERRKSNLELQLQSIDWNGAPARVASQPQARVGFVWRGRF